MATQETLVGEWAPPPEGGSLPITNEDYINQVRMNCRLNLPNVVLASEHGLIMVMVCGGPTSKLFLEDIRKKSQDKEKYRIFCSNKTHDWLIENGIIPDYHFIIDPKKSMLDYVTKPHKDVEYLVGSCCYPEVFKALQGYNVKRLMVYSGIEDQDGMSDMKVISALFHKDEYAALEGGTMAGLRAMPLANILGYTTVEFYGFDSCFFNYDKDGKPIYYSYDKKRLENIMECKTDDGRVFESTPIFASQARQYIKWKRRFEWIKFIIHGDSLTAHIDKIDEALLKPKHNSLITNYMLQLNKEMHKGFKDSNGKLHMFGSVGHEYAGEVSLLAGQFAKKYGEITLLDYGCGAGTLKHALPNITGVKINEYDPCIDEKSATPEPADIVVCTDVLEHIEPECMDNVLDDLKRVTKKTALVSICLTEAAKFYADGRNCHLSILPIDIWYSKLRKRFHIVESGKRKMRMHEYYVCVLQAKEIR